MQPMDNGHWSRSQLVLAYPSPVNNYCDTIVYPLIVFTIYFSYLWCIYS